MEKLDEQQLRVLADLPYGKKYAAVRVAAKEELARRSLNTKTTLSKFEHKYFISKSPTRTKVVKTFKWNSTVFGKFTMFCKYIEFNYDDNPDVFERRFFSITEGRCSWYSDQKEYLEKYYTEITEEEWLKWGNKFKEFYSTMHTLKDWK